MRLRGHLSRLRHDRGGLALVEFALVLPILLVLYLAGFQLSDAIACNRKVTVAARAIADMASQDSTTNAATIDSILGAATQIMAPYPANRAMTRVSEVQTTDSAGNVKVIWSRASGLNPVKLATGATFKLPDATGATWLSGMSMIYGEIIYSYVPPANFGFITAKGLTQSVYMMPRKSDDIPCDDC